jgi:hypothetical protein
MFHAVRGINEDAFGYDFINMSWRGAKEIRPAVFELVELHGEEGIEAHQIARTNEMLAEDAVSTGDIAMGTPPAITPAVGTEPKKSKEKRKKGSKVLFGDKDGDEE